MTSRDLVKGNPGETQAVLIQVSLNSIKISLCRCYGFSCGSESGFFIADPALSGNPAFYITEKIKANFG
jgi:hypothetical protein